MTPAARRLAAILTADDQLQPLIGEDGAGAAKAVRKRREAAADHVRRAWQLSHRLRGPSPRSAMAA